MGWLPQPARLAAFAATGVMVGAIFFNEVRYRLAPKILPDLAETETASEDAGRRALEALSPAQIEEARRQLVARNKASVSAAWSGVADEADPSASAKKGGLVMETAQLLERSAGLSGGAAAVRGFGSEENDAAPVEKKRTAMLTPQVVGAPPGQPTYTNDELRTYLDAESRRLGIQQVIPEPSPNSDDPWAGVPNRPLSKEEARAVMARVTSRLRNSNRDARAANNPTVPLEGLTPVLLGAPEASRPLNVAAAAVAQRKRVHSGRMDIVGIPGSRMSVTRDQAVAFLEEGQKLDRVQGRREYTEAEGRALTKAQKQADADAAYASVKPLALKDMKTEQGLEDTLGIERMPVLRSWGADSGGLGTAGGAVLTSPNDFIDLWKRVGRSETLPAVDFESEMVVAVFGARSDSARRLEIVSVAKQGGRILIRYRIAPVENGKGPTTPYHVAVVERSDYPFGFVQVP